DAAAVRADHQLAIAWMDGQIVDRNRGQATSKSVPLVPAVERDEQTKLSPSEQQILIAKVLADDVQRTARRQVAADGVPSGAVIGGHKKVRGQVVIAVPVDGQVRRPFGEMGALQPA